MPNSQSAQNLAEYQFDSENTIHVELINGIPHFLAKDVCKALGIVNDRDALTNLDDDEKLMSVLPTSGHRRKMNFVNESGLYHLIFQSRKKSAQLFRKWVTTEVLPSIRLTGSYTIGKGAFEGLELRIVNQRRMYLYVEVLRKLEYSISSGFVETRKNKWPGHFVSLEGRVYMSEEFSLMLAAAKGLAKRRKEVYAMQPVLPLDFGEPLNAGGIL
jgi:hypothetical protein